MTWVTNWKYSLGYKPSDLRENAMFFVHKFSLNQCFPRNFTFLSGFKTTKVIFMQFFLVEESGKN